MAQTKRGVSYALSTTMSQAEFDRQIAALLKRVQDLKVHRSAGWGYRRVWVKATTVREHRRAGYHALRQVKRGGR